MWGKIARNIAILPGKVLSFFALIYLLFYAKTHMT
jgi:hypothetical protein